LALLTPLLCAAALVFPAFGVQPGAVLSVLHSFYVFPNGANPSDALVQGRDGYFYGTTLAGGTNGGLGAVFRTRSDGSITSLYSFSGRNDGWGPAGLVQGSDGYFYGTTWAGGTNGGYGTVFRINTNGVLTSLYSFSGGNDGWGPAGLVQGSDGYFYGTTRAGGTNGGHGTVFRISTSGVVTALYSFTGDTDGANPSAALVQGSDGYFYGTCGGGGTYSRGTVFRISANGVLTTLYPFTGGSDGGGPQAVVQGSDGYFYGTCERGGTSGDYGTVFKVSTNGALTTLHSFTGNDGGYPQAGLVQGTDGYFYGTTGDLYGTVFRISTNGTLTTLYSFTGGNDGGYPRAALVQSSDGYFYSTTYSAGTNGAAGTVFRISANGVLTTLGSFGGGDDGAQPIAGLVQGSDGAVYGTTLGGGGALYCGTVFKIDLHVGVLTTLYSFTGGVDGAGPSAALVKGTDGYFYGTTSGESNDSALNSYGTVFRIGTNGALTTLYLFNGGSDGANPHAALVQGSDGNFYGTTSKGGTNGGYGTVFRISTNGALTSLHSFSGTNDGSTPDAALVQGSDGYFYGTTALGGSGYGGTVFRISTNGVLTSLYSFTGRDDGVNPSGGLVQGSDGNFYGTTFFGRNPDDTGSPGTVFRIGTNGALTTLYFFTGRDDGVNPSGGLVQGSDGYFYGTTWGGGANHGGTFFRIGIDAVLTTLYSFSGRNGDGGSPQSSRLVQGSDGYFYGTTSDDGQNNSGTVFRLGVLPVFQPATLTNGTLSLTWSTEAGASYQLQYLSDLNSTNWTNLPSPVTASGGTLTAIDSVTKGPQRFYRVVLLP
jgi:uncharacterized repeat protein (TIGR03803 family)